MSSLNVLTIVFTVLKLCGVITWSWWLIVAPTLLSMSITISLIGLAVLVALLEEFTK